MTDCNKTKRTMLHSIKWFGFSLATALMLAAAPAFAVCGDGTCGAGEDDTNCAEDCGCAALNMCSEGLAPAGCGCDLNTVHFGPCSDICDTCGFCPHSCPETPLTDCKQAEKSKLDIKNNLDSGKDKFKWSWIKGDATTVGEFLDPVNEQDARYKLCIYDSSGATYQPYSGYLAPKSLCSGNECWKAGGSGYAYKDKLGDSTGITKAKLISGEAGKSKIQIKGKGGSLQGGLNPNWMPAEVSVTFPMTAQFIVNRADGSGETCFEATYTEADKDTGSQLRSTMP